MRNIINRSLIALIVLLASSSAFAAAPFRSARQGLAVEQVRLNRLNAALETPGNPSQERSDIFILDQMQSKWHSTMSNAQPIAYLSLYPGTVRILYSYCQQDELRAVSKSGFHLLKQGLENLSNLSLVAYLLPESEGDKIAQLSPMTDQEFAGVKKAVSNILAFTRQKATQPANRSRR
jgi:hypothetical protein